MLSAVVVSGAEGSRHLRGLAVQQRRPRRAGLTGISGGDPGSDGTTVEAAEFEPVAVPAAGLVNLAEPPAGIVADRRLRRGRLRRRCPFDVGNGERTSRRLADDESPLVARRLRRPGKAWTPDDDAHARPAPPRRERVERQEPLHRLGRRRPHREGPRRGGPRRRAAVEAGLLPDVVHTSLQRRAITTAAPVPRRRRPPLDPGEAARGASTSATTARCRARTRSRRSRSTARSSSCSGAARSTPRRRRSTTTSEFSQAADPRYADLGDELPRTECLKDVIARFLPYWEAEIVPDLQTGRTVLVAAHGNSLRALVKHLDQISDEDIAGLNIPTGHAAGLPPRRGRCAHRLRRRVPRPRGRRRRCRSRRQPGSLTPSAAAAGAAAAAYVSRAGAGRR